jgi:hypothetical protein
MERYTAFKQIDTAEDETIYWNEEVELCPDAMYMKLTGRKPEEVLPRLKSTIPA